MGSVGRGWVDNGGLIGAGAAAAPRPPPVERGVGEGPDDINGPPLWAKREAEGGKPDGAA